MSLQRGSRKLWTPQNHGPSVIVWLDAQDQRTIVMSGAFCQTWLDKSGWGNHPTQPTAGGRPSYSPPTSLTAYGYMDMSAQGGAALETTGNITASMNVLGSNTKSMFAVLTCNSGGGYCGHVGWGPLNATGDSFYIATNSTHDPYFIGNTADIDSGIAYSAGTFEMHSIVSRPGLNVLGKNGNTKSQSFFSNSTLATVAGGFLVGIGGGTNWTGNSNSKIYETIVVAGDLWQTGEYQKFEGYLAWKYGLQGSLPSDHRYRLNAPLVTI